MIVALPNQQGGVCKTTLALDFAGERAREGKHVVLIDADPQGTALDRSEQRASQHPTLASRYRRDDVEPPEMAGRPVARTWALWRQPGEGIRWTLILEPFGSIALRRPLGEWFSTCLGVDEHSEQTRSANELRRREMEVE